jgi:hypothetical protein
MMDLQSKSDSIGRSVSHVKGASGLKRDLALAGVTILTFVVRRVYLIAKNPGAALLKADLSAKEQ